MEQLIGKTAEQIDLSYRRFATARQKAATIRAQELLKIFMHSGLKSSPTNEAALDHLFPGPTLNFESFRSYVKQNRDIARQHFEWVSKPFAQVEQAAAAQLAEDKETFANACRKLHIGNNEANFGIIRSTLGENFSIYQVQQAIQSGAVHLAQASREEVDRYRQEAVEQRNQALLNADKGTLQAVARQEVTSQRQAVAQAQFDHDLKFLSAHDKATGKGELPATFNGQPLTAEYVKKASSDTLRMLIRKFGASAVTKLLNGIS